MIPSLWTSSRAIAKKARPPHTTDQSCILHIISHIQRARHVRRQFLVGRSSPTHPYTTCTHSVPSPVSPRYAVPGHQCTAVPSHAFPPQNPSNPLASSSSSPSASLYCNTMLFFVPGSSLTQKSSLGTSACAPLHRRTMPRQLLCCCADPLQQLGAQLLRQIATP